LGTNALSLRGLYAGYGNGTVLEDLSFDLDNGRTLAMLGRNGVGKTTCANVIIGFLPPSAGSITLFGQSIARAAPERIARRGVGLVPQGRRTLPSLTVHETLTFAARPGPWTAERVYGEFPRLKERRKIRGGVLSGGEQQMLAIGRALVTNPKLLLLDEPTEGLAPLIVQELKRFLGRLRGSGMTTVLIEQNAKLALSVADDALIIRTGRVSYAGTARQLVDDPSILDSELGLR
jgi:branched-chain amino acid transport system ATP-binding protein